LLEPRNEPRGRGLPASRWPEQGKEFTSGDVQIDSIDGRSVAESLRQLDELNIATGHCRLRSRSGHNARRLD
jgi:hypothetical protein